MQSPATAWGITRSEQAMTFPCDRYLTNADSTYFRAVTVNASASLVFRWLCQLKVAPYSYDWIDNGGRQSPYRLIPGIEQLEVGQRVMTIFRLVEFEQDHHLTLELTRPRARAMFGSIVLSYVVVPQTEQRCRLLVKLHVRYPRRGTWSLMRYVLPWGDLIMMRKQLLTLKALSESSVV
jgi:hypothetical protein